MNESRQAMLTIGARAAYESEWGAGSFDKASEAERDCWRRTLEASLNAIRASALQEDGKALEPVAWRFIDKDGTPGLVTPRRFIADTWIKQGFGAQPLYPAPPSVALAGEASLPTYGNLPWDQLGRDVMESTTGTRSDFPFNEKFYPGHHTPGINFNSLARIIDKYRLTRPQPGGAVAGTEQLSEHNKFNPETEYPGSYGNKPSKE